MVIINKQGITFHHVGLFKFFYTNFQPVQQLICNEMDSNKSGEANIFLII